MQRCQDSRMPGAGTQVTALQKIFSGARNSAGQPLFYTWPWDPGIGHPNNDWCA